MKSVEKTGKTIDEAVEKALAELGISKDEAEIEVLIEPSRGFLGILGGNDAKVKVTVKPSRVDLAKKFVSGIIERMNIPASFESREREDALYIDVFGENLGILIGRRGETLRCLEFLTNVASGNGIGNVKRVVVDVAGYRKRRESDLQQMARSVARRVERFGRRAILDVMDARDRRIVHVALQDNPRVSTHSEGEEPFRRVVIEPNKES